MREADKAPGAGGRGNLERADLRGFPEPPGISESLGCCQWERYHVKMGRDTAGSAPTLSLQVGQVTSLHGVCVPRQCGSAGARLLPSFAQGNAAFSSLASAVVLSPGVAATRRHRDVLHTSLGWRKEKQEREARVCFLWDTGWKNPLLA